MRFKPSGWIGVSRASALVSMRANLPVISRRVLAYAHGHGLVYSLSAILVVLVILALAPDQVVLPETRTTVEVSSRTTFFGGWVVSVLALSATYEPVPQVARISPRGWVAPRAARLAMVIFVALVGIALADVEAPLFGVGLTATLIGEGLLSTRVFGSSLAWLTPTATRPSFFYCRRQHLR